jgi:hypothetical protein
LVGSASGIYQRWADPKDQAEQEPKTTRANENRESGDKAGDRALVHILDFDPKSSAAL